MKSAGRTSVLDVIGICSQRSWRWADGSWFSTLSSEWGSRRDVYWNVYSSLVLNFSVVLRLFSALSFLRVDDDTILQGTEPPARDTPQNYCVINILSELLLQLWMVTSLELIFLEDINSNSVSKKQVFVEYTDVRCILQNISCSIL